MKRLNLVEANIFYLSLTSWHLFLCYPSFLNFFLCICWPYSYVQVNRVPPVDRPSSSTSATRDGNHEADNGDVDDDLDIDELNELEASLSRTSLQIKEPSGSVWFCTTHTVEAHFFSQHLDVRNYCTVTAPLDWSYIGREG